VTRRFGEKIIFEPPLILLPLLISLSFVYRALVSVHRWFYRRGLLRRSVLPRPVVSIGNLSMGGSGKTPLVMWLAERLHDEGIKAAILTRGYGRLEKGTVIADQEADWERLGDEPALMVKKFKGLTIAVSPDRYQGGMEVLKRQDVDLFILDDGFGHHALKKDLEIVVVDERRRFGKGRLLPAGILREPLSRLKDAHVIVVTKAADVDVGFEKEIGRHADAPVVWADYRPEGLVPADGVWNVPQKMAYDGPYLGFCGIADPESFRDSLERAGVETLEVLSFLDHHPYSTADVSNINEKAGKLGARALVTTEKDGVRWPSMEDSLPCFVLAMKVFVSKGESILVDMVTSAVKRSDKRSR
jgi:tetraacyldisaccharide 4'-kinase